MRRHDLACGGAISPIGAEREGGSAVFKHILIATDGGDLSRKAVVYGVRLAKALGARVTALTVMVPYHAASMDAVLIAETAEEHEASVGREADRALEQAAMAAEAAGAGFARAPRRRRAGDRQRDRQGAQPQRHSGAGLSLRRRTDVALRRRAGTGHRLLVRSRQAFHQFLLLPERVRNASVFE
jgi:hypothetical protein